MELRYVLREQFISETCVAPSHYETVKVLQYRTIDTICNGSLAQGRQKWSEWKDVEVCQEKEGAT